MRKEILFAIVAGGVIGLVIAFGFWRANSALSPTNNGANTNSSSSTTPPTPGSEFKITIATPTENDVIITTPYNITGITMAGVTLVISGENDDSISYSGSDGSFNQPVNLVGGMNEIILTTFDSKGVETTNKVTVVYSPEFSKIISKSAQPSTQKEKAASDEAESIRANVQKKVDQVLNSPKAFIGTITDIAGTTLQIKNASGEIQQANTSKDTIFIKTGTTSKEIKYSEVAIGDYIIGMGFKNGNGVFDARRILISQPVPASSRQAVLVKVTKANKNDLSVKFVKNQDTLKIVPAGSISLFQVKNGKSVKIKFSDIKSEDSIIALGSKIKDVFEAKTIFVVQSNEVPATNTPKPILSPKPTAKPSPSPKT
jgi:hypothetical protein